MALSGTTPNLNQIDAGKLEESTHVPTEDEKIAGYAKSMRVDLDHTELEVRQLADMLKAKAAGNPGAPPRPDRALISEAIAQAMLALRHVEDARMRLGKVLQYAVQGGVPYGAAAADPLDREGAWEIIREVGDRFEHGQTVFPMEVEIRGCKITVLSYTTPSVAGAMPVLRCQVDGRLVELQWGHGQTVTVTRR